MSWNKDVTAAPKACRILGVGIRGDVHIVYWAQPDFGEPMAWCIENTGDDIGGNMQVLHMVAWQHLPEVTFDIGIR